MDEKILEQIKEKLVKRKNELEKSLKGFASKNIHNESDYTANFPDFGNEQDGNVEEVSTFSDNLSLERTLEKSMNDIEEALKRIEAGTYGKCRYCGNEIGEKRLLVRPVSGACMKCKSKLTE
ncbi:TraR/DksA family transcriptional regulator [Patescibacteria group bacterium]